MNAFAFVLRISDGISGLKLEYMKKHYGNFSICLRKNIIKKEIGWKTSFILSSAPARFIIFITFASLLFFEIFFIFHPKVLICFIYFTRS